MPFAALGAGLADAAGAAAVDVGLGAAADVGLGAAADVGLGAAADAGLAGAVDAAGLGAADAFGTAGIDLGAIGGSAGLGVDAASVGLADAAAGFGDISGALGGVAGDLSAVPIGAGSAGFDAATAGAAGLGGAVSAAPAAAALAPSAALSGIDTGVSAALGGADAFAGAAGVPFADTSLAVDTSLGSLGAAPETVGATGAADFGATAGVPFADTSSAVTGALGAAPTDLTQVAADFGQATGSDFAGFGSPIGGVSSVPETGGFTSVAPDLTTPQSIINSDFSNFPNADVVGQVPSGPTPVTTTTFTQPSIIGTDPATGAPIEGGAAGGSPTVSGATAATPASPVTPGSVAPDVTGQGAASAGAGAPTGIPGAATQPGLASQVAGVLNSPFTRAAELGLPLAALAAIGLRGPQKVPGQTQTAVNNAQDLAALSSQQAAIGQSGQLSPSQLAQITIATNAQKNQLYQLYASMGRDPTKDSDYIQGIQQIDNNAIAQYQQFIQAAITNAISAGGTADNALIAAGNQQIQLDTNFEQALLSATQSFALLAGLSNINNRMTA